MSATMMDRQQAREIGSKTYFTGKPCKYGHVSLRYTVNGHCSECAVNDSRRFYAANADLCRRLSREYVAAHPDDNARRSREWMETATPEQKEKCRSSNKAWKIRNADSLRVSSGNRRALKRSSGVRITVAEWKSLKDRFGNRCLSCGVGEASTPLTQDHIIPLAHGGTHALDNLQPLCLRCNLRKGVQHTDYRTERGNGES